MPETAEQIADRVARKHMRASPAPGPGSLELADPVILRKIFKEIKKAKDRGLLIEPPASDEPSNQT